MKYFVVFLIISLAIFSGKSQTITCSVTTLPSFGNSQIFFSSSPQKYSVSATGLTSNLILNAATGFEISLVCAQQFSGSISIIPNSGNVSATNIYVRFSPSTTGSISGNITHTSIGAIQRVISAIGSGTNWSIPSNYYSTASGNGSTLKTSLYTKISGSTTALSYAGLWTAFNSTDIGYNGKIWDVYSTSVCETSPYTYTYSTDQCGNYSVEGDCYNREHSFPQDWFNSASPMYTELFHIYPTDGKVNGMRSNYPYGVVTSPTWTSQLGAKLGNNTSSGYSGIVFEPVDEYKGDLARTYFFMATRYENIIGGWYSNSTQADAILIANNSSTVYKTWYLNLMLAWHNQDPISTKEINRNNAIYSLQNNRNPFIDSPQFVKKIWGGSIPSKPTLACSGISFTNKTSTSMQINWRSGNGNKRIVVIKAGAAVNAMPVDSNYYLANAVFGSGTQMGSGNYVVYNGSGSSVVVSGLTWNVNYFATIYEYNGWYSTSNYQTSGALSGNSILPVVWLDFNAELINSDQIKLDWSTASEINNSRFEIERTFDNKNWETIGNVKGNGNTNSISNYQFIDNALTTINQQSSTIYYRLKQVDFDGKFEYSKTVSVKLLENNKIEISPNPFTDEISLKIPLIYKNNLIEIFDLTGRKVFEKIILDSEVKINLNSITDKGLYFLKVDECIFKIYKD